jgi:hypothetical protein
MWKKVSGRVVEAHFPTKTAIKQIPVNLFLSAPRKYVIFYREAELLGESSRMVFMASSHRHARG